MRVRDRIGLNFPPLLLRLMLGTVVLWMGLGKIMGRYDVQGRDAAVLANLGVIAPVTATPAPPNPAAAPPATTPADAPPATTPPGAQPPTAPTGSTGSTGAHASPRSSAIRLAAQTVGPAKYTAADFQTPVKVRRLYTVALAIMASAEPGAKQDGSPKSATWPKALADGRWPVYIAWTSALTETIGGVALLIGMLTRFCALAIGLRMLAAMWLIQIGPAIQGGDAVLGFLPNHDAFDVERWRPLVVHFALMMTSFALLFLGPGRASFDHAIFAQARTDDDDDDEE